MAISQLLAGLNKGLERANRGTLQYRPQYGSNLSDLGRNQAFSDDAQGRMLFGLDRNQVIRESQAADEIQSQRKDALLKADLDFRQEADKRRNQLFNDELKLRDKHFEAGTKLSEKERKIMDQQLTLQGIGMAAQALSGEDKYEDKLAFIAEMSGKQQAANGAVALANQMLDSGQPAPEIIKTVRDINLARFNKATNRYEVNPDAIPTVSDYNKMFGAKDRSKRLVGSLFKSGVFGKDLQTLGDAFLGDMTENPPPPPPGDGAAVSPVGASDFVWGGFAPGAAQPAPAEEQGQPSFMSRLLKGAAYGASLPIGPVLAFRDSLRTQPQPEQQPRFTVIPQ